MPERVFTAFMIDDAFPVVGLRPLLGRGFTPDELRPNGPPAAVISHRLWRSRSTAIARCIGRNHSRQRQRGDAGRRHASGAAADRHGSVDSMGRPAPIACRATAVRSR
jgi:hypothetical protein